MQIRPKHRPQWTEEELDVIFSKATLVLGELRKDASGVLTEEGITNSFHVSLSDNYRTLEIQVLLLGNTILSSYQ